MVFQQALLQWNKVHQNVQKFHIQLYQISQSKCERFEQSNWWSNRNGEAFRKCKTGRIFHNYLLKRIADFLLYQVFDWRRNEAEFDAHHNDIGGFDWGNTTCNRSFTTSMIVA